jgi:tRNA(Ile)-lysidine synthase
VTDGGLRYDPQAPRAIALRVVTRIVEGFGGSPRGGAIVRLVAELESGGQGNVAGVSARTDGDSWVFRPETPRRA